MIGDNKVRLSGAAAPDVPLNRLHELGEQTFWVVAGPVTCHTIRDEDGIDIATETVKVARVATIDAETANRFFAQQGMAL